MHELESRAQLLALRLERSPDFAIRRVVVDDLHDQVRIVELRERLEGFAHDLERLVVRRDLDRNLGEVVGVDGMDRIRSAAQRVHDLEQVGQRKRQRRQLQHEQQRGRDQVDRVARHRIGDGRGVEQVRDGGQRCRGKHLRAQPAPAAQGYSQDGGNNHRADRQRDLEIALLADDGGVPGDERDQGQAKGKAGPDAGADDPWHECCDRDECAQGAKEQGRMEEHAEKTPLNSF